MDTSQMHGDWALWGPKLQLHFPQVQIPDIFPHGALWQSLVERVALAHDLTVAEVGEVIEEIALVLTPRTSRSEAA